MKALILWGLRQKKWTIFWWCVGIVAFIALELAFYPTFKSQAASLNETFKNLPPTAKALFLGNNDMFSPIGYLNGRVFYLMLPLLLSILAIGQGASLIAKEERDGTIELLLARPVSRARFLVSKALIGFIMLLVASIAATVATIVLCTLVDLSVSTSGLILAGMQAMLLSLSVGAIAFFVAALGRTARSASIGLAAMIALGGYIIASLSEQVTWLQWPAKFLPFNYYHPTAILQGTIKLSDSLLFVGVSLILGLVSWVAFRHRDIGA